MSSFFKTQSHRARLSKLLEMHHLHIYHSIKYGLGHSKDLMILIFTVLLKNQNTSLNINRKSYNFFPELQNFSCLNTNKRLKEIHKADEEKTRTTTKKQWTLASVPVLTFTYDT